MLLIIINNMLNYGGTCERLDLRKSKQGNTTNLNISFSNERKPVKVVFKPMTYSLLTELLKQLSWLSQIEAIQGQPV